MSIVLTDLQKRLCNRLQCGLEFVERPFEVVASLMGSDESTIISEIQELKRVGVLRRIGATVNYRALGRASVLVTARLAEDKLSSVVNAVNALEGVSHNYLRGHEYNLWFTLQAANRSEIEYLLAELGRKFDVIFYALSAIETFKLDVRFDAFSNGTKLLPADSMTKNYSDPIRLDDESTAILKILAMGIEISPQPFRCAGFDEKRVIEIAQRLLEKQAIRRFAAVLDYRKLGFISNAMLVCAVEQEQIKTIGLKLANLDCISHCYQRKIFPGWPYNLFGMMHGSDMGMLEKKAAAFASENTLGRYELLPTIKEFKKKPVSL